MKRQYIPTVLTVVSLVLGIFAMAMLGVSTSVPGYTIKNAWQVIAGGVIVLLCVLLVGRAASKSGDKVWTDIVLFVSVVGLALSFAFVLVNIVPYAPGLFTYDSHNELCRQAFETGVASAAAYLISAIMLAVTLFFDRQKKKQ